PSPCGGQPRPFTSISRTEFGPGIAGETGMNTKDQFDWGSLGRDRCSNAPGSLTTGGHECRADETPAINQNVQFGKDRTMVYQDRDRAAPVIAEVGPGDVQQSGPMTDQHGWSWLAVTLSDGRGGYIRLGRAEPASRRTLYYAIVAVPLLIL